MNGQTLADISRALGLAQALAKPLPGGVRSGSTEEVAEQIVVLLERVRDRLLDELVESNEREVA